MQWKACFRLFSFWSSLEKELERENKRFFLMNGFNFFSGNELNRSYERIRKIEDEKKSLQIWRAGLFWVKNSFLLLPMQKITIFISLNKKRKKSLSRTPMNPSGCANIGALVWHIFFNEKLFPKNKTTFFGSFPSRRCS